MYSKRVITIAKPVINGAVTYNKNLDRDTILGYWHIVPVLVARLLVIGTLFLISIFVQLSNKFTVNGNIFMKSKKKKTQFLLKKLNFEDHDS